MNKFLVYTIENGIATSVNFCSPVEIFRMIDMQDCSEAQYEVYSLHTGKPELLKIHGKRHNLYKPLYIRLTDINGNVVIAGKGTDH